LRNGLLPPQPAGQPRRWHVVHVAGAGIGRSLGDARILINYLDQRQQGDYRWLAWSKDHPAAARCFWSSIAHVARQNLYILIPELVHLAESTRDAAQMQQQLSSRLADQYLWLAQTHARLGRHAQAVLYYSQALREQTTPRPVAEPARTGGWDRPTGPVPT
jgi:hypothetical protein